MKWLLLLWILCIPLKAEIYITVKGAKVKAAKLALGQVHDLPDYRSRGRMLPSSIREQLRSDLELANIFEFIDEKSFKQLDTKETIRYMRYDSWNTTGASFVLRIGHRVQGKQLILEALLYDIHGKKKVFGTRYQYTVKQFPRLVHALIEDILRELTGESGLFRSRILMVCRDTTIPRKRTKRGARTKVLPKNIYVTDPDGRNFSRITSDKTLTLSPNWSPDGRHITYTQYEYRYRSGKYETIPVLRKHDLQTGRRMIISEKRGMNSGAAWSPDGRKIAATLSYTGRPELYIFNSDGTGKPTPLSRSILWRRVSGTGFQPNYVSLLFDVEPSWAPDGIQMVFSSARTGHPMIYVVDLKKRIAKQLTFAGTYNSSPDWSPRGDKILFAAQRIDSGNFDIYSIDPDGNNLSRITMGKRVGRKLIHSENPSFAPTGRHFTYANNRTGKYAVYISTLDGKVVRRISPKGMECVSPAWGPFER